MTREKVTKENITYLFEPCFETTKPLVKVQRWENGVLVFSKSMGEFMAGETLAWLKEIQGYRPE